MGYLDYTKRRGNFSIIPSSGGHESSIEPLVPLLQFIKRIKTVK